MLNRAIDQSFGLVAIVLCSRILVARTLPIVHQPGRLRNEFLAAALSRAA